MSPNKVLVPKARVYFQTHYYIWSSKVPKTRAFVHQERVCGPLFWVPWSSSFGNPLDLNQPMAGPSCPTMVPQYGPSCGSFQAHYCTKQGPILQIPFNKACRAYWGPAGELLNYVARLTRHTTTIPYPELTHIVVFSQQELELRVTSLWLLTICPELSFFYNPFVTQGFAFQAKSLQIST